MRLADGRRAALVAAVLGLLAFLAYGTAALSPGASTYGVGAVVRGGEQLAATLVATHPVGRGGQQPVARMSGPDRAPTTHSLGWGLGLTLLLLAAAALAGGVRRLCRRATPAPWRGALASRAPPALAR